MKILFIEPGGYGATFQYTHNLANALAELNHKVTLATGLNYEIKNYPILYDLYLVFDRLTPRPLKLIKFLVSILRTQPDIIHIQGHSHPEMYWVIWKILQNISNAKLIYTAQDIFPKIKRKLHPIALKKLYYSASHIFVNAVQNKETLLKAFSMVQFEKITVIPIPDLTAFVNDHISLKNFSSIPTNSNVVLFFGIIEPRKGIFTLIRAFSKVIKQCPSAFLLIVGKSFEDIQPYFQEIDRLGICDRILFHNEYIPLEQIPSLFSYADVFVAPYLKGWNSGAIATAYAYGKPVIASDVGGFSEVIENGKSGFLVPPNDENKLAEAISLLIQDNTLRLKMSEFALSLAEKNSWPQIAKKTEQIYLNVISAV